MALSAKIHLWKLESLLSHCKYWLRQAAIEWGIRLNWRSNKVTT